MPKSKKPKSKKPKPAPRKRKTGSTGRIIIFLFLALVGLYAAHLALVYFESEPQKAAKLPVAKIAAEIARLNKAMVLNRRGKILSHPARKSQIVGYLEKGAVVKVTGKVKKEGTVWYRIVRYGGKHGYLTSVALAEIKK